MSKQRSIEVVADWVGLAAPTLMGHHAEDDIGAWERVVRELAEELASLSPTHSYVGSAPSKAAGTVTTPS